MKIKVKRVIRNHRVGAFKLVRKNEKTELHKKIEKYILNKKLISLDLLYQKKKIYTSLTEINETIVEIEISDMTLYLEYFKGIYSIAFQLDDKTSLNDAFVYKIIKRKSRHANNKTLARSGESYS